MRYRRLGQRYTMVVTSGQPRPFGESWLVEQVGVIIAQPRWRPDADVYETARALTVMVDLAGVEEDDLDVLLFEDAVVIEGRRRLPACEEGAVYHAAAIRQGPFRAEIPLPVAVDPERVEARSERGILQLVLPKADRR